MTTIVDTDKSGLGFQKQRVYLGPSLGWSEEYVQPSTRITTAGTYLVQPGDGLLLCDAPGPVTIQLPDVRVWWQQAATQPATGWNRQLCIKDFAGNASINNITVAPLSGQRIDADIGTTAITIDYATFLLVPNVDLSGWIIAAGTTGVLIPVGTFLPVHNPNATGKLTVASVPGNIAYMQGSALGERSVTFGADPASGDADVDVHLDPLSAGKVYIDSTLPNLTFNPPSTTAINTIAGWKAGKARWEIELGGAEAEGGGNTGSYFNIRRFSDAGVLIDNPIIINRFDALTTFSGNIAMDKVNPIIILRKTASGEAATISGSRGVLARWAMQLGTQTPETGSDVGSNFALLRYFDGGGQAGVPIFIERATGQMTLEAPLNLPGNPVLPLQAATKQYVDTFASGAPVSAEYIVAAGNPTLTNERKLLDTPSITWDFTIPGEARGNVPILSTVGTGLLVQTGTGTYALRTLGESAIGGIGWQDPTGSAGNPTLVLKDDLLALESLGGTNTIYYRSGLNTWSPVVIGTNLNFTGGTLSATAGGGGGDVFKALANTFTAQNCFTNVGVVIGNTSAFHGNSLEAHAVSPGQLSVVSASAWLNLANGPNFAFFKSRGTTVGSMTLVQQNDTLGSIRFHGSDGTAFAQAAVITGVVDVVLSAGQMAGNLTFQTKPVAGALTTRMTIASDGNTGFSSPVTMNAASGAGFGQLHISAPGAPSTADLFFKNAALNRWLIRAVNAAAESGSNAGSNLSFQRYDDAGASIGTVLNLIRQTGEAQFSNKVNLLDTTDSTTMVSGALIIAGGLGVLKQITARNASLVGGGATAPALTLSASANGHNAGTAIGVTANIVHVATTPAIGYFHNILTATTQFDAGSGTSASVGNSFNGQVTMVGNPLNVQQTVVSVGNILYGASPSGSLSLMAMMRLSTPANGMSGTPAVSLSLNVGLYVDNQNVAGTGVTMGACRGIFIAAQTPPQGIGLWVDPGHGYAGIYCLDRILCASTKGMGYDSGAGGTVVQTTSQTTTVSINKICGTITLFSAAGNTGLWQTFSVGNITVASPDMVNVSQVSGANKYMVVVTRTFAGGFDISFISIAGTAVEAPVFGFSVIKGALS